MNADALTIAFLALLLLGAFGWLFVLTDALDRANARLAETRLRLWTFAELLAERESHLAPQLEALFPEIVRYEPAAPADCSRVETPLWPDVYTLDGGPGSKGAAS